MAEREGFEGEKPKPQLVDARAKDAEAINRGTQNGTHSVGVGCPVLAKVIECWPRLNANLRAAIAAIVATQEEKSPPMAAP